MILGIFFFNILGFETSGLTSHRSTKEATSRNRSIYKHHTYE